ncbi:MAG TPA: thioredoxin domain-containing protein [Methanomicrobiales archaeon]|jgi:glutaredoxin|nr:thioredoxin domain-containing protein [Methanomicrobiales archaeon]
MTRNQIQKEEIHTDREAASARQPGTQARIDPVIAVVAGVIVIVCVIIFVMLSPGPESGPAVFAATCGEKTLSYVNSNLVMAGTAATLVSVNETHGIYEVTVAYQGNEVPLFVTRDCVLLFNQGRDMTAPSGGTQGEETTTPTPAPVKTDRPSVELYVMSFCPYGIQAETAMKPVADLLGSRAAIRVFYLTRVGGATVDSVESLHGPVEVQEDLRQACIQKNSPAKFWAYLDGFNTACSSLSGNASAAAACSTKVSSSLGIGQTRLQLCVSGGTEGLDLLSADQASANVKGATASPTLFINGVTYSGARTPEAYKEAICGSFTSPPAECHTMLSTRQVAAGGSC